MTREVTISELRLEAPHWVNPRTFTGLSGKPLDDLAASIAKQGILDPPKVVMVKSVNDDFFTLVIDGQRRVITGLQELGKNAKIQVVDMEDEPIELTPEKADELMLKALTMGKREGLASYELAEVAAHLRSRERMMADIAEAIGKSESWVSKMLKARTNATPKLLHSWRKGDITDEQFKELAAEKEPEAQNEATKEVVETRKAGHKAEARTHAKEIVETAKQRKKREKAEKVEAKLAAKAAKKAELEAKKAAKANKGKPGKTNGHTPVVAGEQQQMWKAPPPVKPKKPDAPSKLVLTEMVGLCDKRPPTHDYVKGLMDGARYALGELQPDAFGKPWAQYLSRLGGTTKPVKKAKAGSGARKAERQASGAKKARKAKERKPKATKKGKR